MQEHGMDSALITTAEGRLGGILYLEDIQRRLMAQAGGRRAETTNLRPG